MSKCIAILFLLTIYLNHVSQASALTAKTAQGRDETSGSYSLGQFGGANSDEKTIYVETRDLSFKCWAALRFDLTGIQSRFDAEFPHGWQIDKVWLNMTDAYIEGDSWLNWVTPGQIAIRWTADDTLDITHEAPKSPLVMNEPPLDPVHNQFSDGNGMHLNMVNYDKSHIKKYEYVLFDPVNGINALGNQQLVNDIATDNTVTLALVDADSQVKAVFHGWRSMFIGDHPQLCIEASAESTIDSFDWRNVNGKDYTTPVKDLGSCGVCYMFATAGCLESKFKMHFNRPDWNPDLSEMQMIQSGVGGCGYGLTDNAMIFAYTNGLVDDAECPFIHAYPYPDLIWPLWEGWENRLYRIDEHPYYLNNPSAEAVKEAIKSFGPVVYRMNWNTDCYNRPSKSDWGNWQGQWPNHAVLIVGYQDDPEVESGGYFIIENNEGTDFGDNGYGYVRYEVVEYRIGSRRGGILVFGGKPYYKTSDYLDVTYPDGKESLLSGTPINICWDTKNEFNAIKNVSIELSTNNGSDWAWITPSTPNDGSYIWMTPEVHSDHCLIKISDVAIPAITSTSNETFSIYNTLSVKNLDINGDNKINLIDLSMLSEFWCAEGQ